MDPRCKRPRTASPKKKPGFVDRLSPSPDDVLHRVLSYLEFVDVARTSVLSKRWRFVWTSMRYSNFDMDRFVKHKYDERFQLVEPRSKFWDFMKRPLLLRDGSQIVQINHAYNTLMEQLNGLLRGAAKEKLTANFNSLRSLNLTVHISRNVVERLLSSDYVKLEYLEDCRVGYSEQVNISASNLKNLTIVNLCSSGKFWVVGGFESELRISAPKLVSLMLRGFALLNKVSLKNASICLLRIPQGL